MNLTEKVAYIKGLMEGLALDQTSKEGKVHVAMYDLLEDMAFTMYDLEDEVAEVNEIIDEIDEDLSNLEDIVYDDDDDDEDDDEDDDDDDEECFDIVCDNCGNEICLEGDMFLEDEIACPKCGEKITIEWDLEGDKCGCGCDDDDCDDEECDCDDDCCKDDSKSKSKKDCGCK